MPSASSLIRYSFLFEESISCRDTHFSSYLAHSSSHRSPSPICHTLQGITYPPQMIGSLRKYGSVPIFYSPDYLDTFLMIIFDSLTPSLFEYR